MGHDSQAAQSFLHLLAVAADGSHEPQTFRLRWDQPLRRFARAYAVFRELSAESESTLRLSTPEHPELDLDATASTYAFCDGQEVLFTAGAEVSLSPTASQRAQKTQPSQGGMKRPAGASQKSDGKAATAASQSMVWASQKVAKAKAK